VFNHNFKKEDLIKILNSKTGYSLNFSKKLINDLLEIMIQNLDAGNLNLKNLGAFRILKKSARVGRNPKTNEEFKISARKAVSFTPSRKITEYLNKST